MNETIAATPEPAPLPGLLSRFIGIITSPKATFEAVVRNPKWVGMLALIVVLSGASQFAMTATERGRQAALEFQVKKMEQMGMTVTDEMYTRMQEQQTSPIARVFSLVGVVIIFPVFFILLPAAILYAIFNAIMGGTANFKQVVAVLVHAWVVLTVAGIIGTALNMTRGTMETSVANIGMLLPMLTEGSFAGNLASSIDLFRVWFVIVLAMGLGVLYKRKTANVAMGLFAVYALFAVCVSYFFRAKG
jgi:hypothetical protein